MKKIITILVMVFLFTGCANLFPKYTTYENIDYETFMEKINNKETFVILVWKTGCEYCEAFDPILEEVIKEKEVKIYGIDMSKLNEEEWPIVTNKTLTKGTPTLVYFEKGVRVNKLNGKQPKENVIRFLEKTNIKEK